MSEADIIQHQILSQGQDQDERMPAALDSHFADIDEYSPADLLRFMQRLAPHVNYYSNDDATTPSDNWQHFFPFNDNEVQQWLDNLDDATPAHLGLIRSFLTLYQEPQKAANQLTGKHLDFYYQRVLRLQSREAVPDKAHLLLQLKKNTQPVAVSPHHQFSAGKDATGVERIYQPIATTIINHAQVASIRSLFQDKRSLGAIRYAPIANSSDGVGGELESEEAKWSGFGSANLPTAETGFALSAPVLRMATGLRVINVRMRVSHTSELNSTRLQNSLQVYLSGASQWLGPYTITPTLSGNYLSFSITLSSADEAIVNYDASIHGYNYDAQAPLIQCFLNQENSQTGYLPFSAVRLIDVKINVEVSELTELTLQNDLGSLDSKKAFMPFGPQPSKGSRLFIAHPEALEKNLSELSLSFTWQDAPTSFSTHYSGYSVSVNNNSFSASVTFKDGDGWDLSVSNKALFNSSNATETHTLTFGGSSSETSSGSSSGNNSGSSSGNNSGNNSNAQIITSLYYTNTSWAQNNLNYILLVQPIFYALAKVPVTKKAGFITLTLERDFLHKTYRKDYVKKVVEFPKSNATTITILNEPYTPTLQALSLAYHAHSHTVKVNTNSLADFASSDVSFYHIGYFGQMREHTYQRHQFDFVSNKTAHLLPRYQHDGELLIGITDLSPGDSVNLLCQVAEGSADPDLTPGAITWSVLCDNYWKTLNKSELISDSTNNLLTSGIIQFVIPSVATTHNTLLPTNMIWLRASLSGDIASIPQLIDIAANAVEVKFVDHNNDVNHLAKPLSAGNIAKLKTPIAAIKAVAQPYASFGGAMAEPKAPFHTRVAERLRHKDRAITPWDYERLVLSAFSSVHKCKAIAHAKPGAWLAPGNVLVIVVPDLNNRNAVNPLQPKVDSNSIAQISDFLTQRSAMQAKVHVRNPRYQQIQLSFRVKFHTGFEFNYYSQVLQSEIIKHLSPWAHSDVVDMQFGGKIYKSVLIDFIDELPYVDFLTDFKLSSTIDGVSTTQDGDSLQPQAPDIILASANNHIIQEYLAP